MVTSLTAALFLHFLALPPAVTPALAPTASLNPDKATLHLVHNLAQYVHSLAQGKVGSGFDVSAAVWGSQVYRRFAVECLGDLLASNESTKVRSPFPRRRNRFDTLHSSLRKYSCRFFRPYSTTAGPLLSPRLESPPSPFRLGRLSSSPTSMLAVTPRAWLERFSLGKRPLMLKVR